MDPDPSSSADSLTINSDLINANEPFCNGWILVIFFSCLLSIAQKFFSDDFKTNSSWPDKKHFINKFFSVFRDHLPQTLILLHSLQLLISLMLPLAVTQLYLYLNSGYIVPLFEIPTLLAVIFHSPVSFITINLCSLGMLFITRWIIPNFAPPRLKRQCSYLLLLPLFVYVFISLPIMNMLRYIRNKMERHWIQQTVKGLSASIEDLDIAIDLALERTVSTDKQVNILKGILQFKDVVVKQVMTPRTEINGLDFTMTFPEVLSTIRISGFSRFPVYQDDLDHINGILYTKDLISYLQESESFEWQTLIRPDVLYIPEHKPINDLLHDFRTQHKHMAFVVDEYGGTRGLVTLEDIMEEIVGDIKDEFDEHQEVQYIRLDPNNFLFEGKTLINDMCRVLGLEIDFFDSIRGNADSVAGLILEQSGELPYKEQVILIRQLKFTITAVSKKRIEQVKVTAS